MTDQPLNPPLQTPGTGAEPVVAFCQQCGRALTATAMRKVGAGIYCEPCSHVPQSYTTPTAASGFENTGYRVVNPDTTPSDSVGAGLPHPVAAGLLGLIPGVGAMYNGQYAKGLLHLVVFVILVSLANDLNEAFGWFVSGWIFYQAFDAYHTALARREGRVPPNPFGWNDLDERMRFHQNRRSPGSQTPPPTTPPDLGAVAPSASSTVGLGNVAGGYTGGSTSVDEQPVVAMSSPATSTAYSPVYTSFSAGSTGDRSDVSNPVQASNVRQIPAGAVWLIGLGLLFLVGNLSPAWHLKGRWLVPLLLAILAVWLGTQRAAAVRRLQSAAGSLAWTAYVEAIQVPAFLLLLAILFAVQTAHWIPLRHSWPTLLILWGALLLLMRVGPATANSNS